jgi:hypothetical protein
MVLIVKILVLWVCDIVNTGVPEEHAMSFLGPKVSHL